MGVIEKFGIPKPISKILNWARAYDMWYFQFGLACCAEMEMKLYNSYLGLGPESHGKGTSFPNRLTNS